MYGVGMASYAEYFSITSDNNGVVILDDGKITNIKEIWQEFTSFCMGHKNIKSSNIYFNPDEILFEMVLTLLENKQKEFQQKKEIIKNKIISNIPIYACDCVSKFK